MKNPLASELPALNAIVDVEAAARAGWRPVDLARAFIAGGARFLQLRAKTMPGGQLLDTASAIVALAHGCGALAVINDRADVARLAGADGVHGGQDDLAPAAARSLVGEHAIVGLSTHTLEQIDQAVRLAPGRSGAISYVAIGPVFGTTTKATGYERIGLETVREADEGHALDFVIALDVPEAELVERLLHRARVEGRADDTRQAIAERMHEYHKLTEAVLDHYSRQGVPVKRVDGLGSPEEVFWRIRRAIGISSV